MPKKKVEDNKELIRKERDQEWKDAIAKHNIELPEGLSTPQQVIDVFVVYLEQTILSRKRPTFGQVPIR